MLSYCEGVSAFGGADWESGRGFLAGKGGNMGTGIGRGNGGEEYSGYGC
jgi:hypothetical protein